MICPGCGRCRECGRPAPAPAPASPYWPYAPVPSYPGPGVYPLTVGDPWPPSPYVGDGPPLTVTC